MINNHIAADFVVRDEIGRPILAGARSLGENTINVAECVSLRDALWMTRSWGFRKIQIEGESKLMIDSIFGWCSIPWRLRLIIQDIKILASWFENISWSHIFRETNFLADAIREVGFSYCNLHVWDKSIPSVAHRALLFDCMQTECTRSYFL